MAVTDRPTFGMYVRTMHKWLRVTASFPNDIQANEYLSRHPDEGVVAVLHNVVLIANLYDKGTHIPD